MEARALFSLIVVLVVWDTAGIHSQNAPPKLITPDKHSTSYIHGGRSQSLQCHAEGSPEPTYQWRLNDDEPRNVIVNETTGTLTISKFEDSHEGNYQCLAEKNISGNVVVAMSAVTTLWKFRLVSDWPVSPGGEVTSPLGGYSKLTCDNPPPSVPALQFSWYVVEKKDGHGGHNDVEQISPDERIHIDAAGTLHFVYLKGSDEKYRYKCGISNKGGDLIKLGSEKDLQVTDQDKGIQQNEAARQFYTSNAKFMRTKEAILECVYSGYPIPKITWFDTQKKRISNNEKFSILENSHQLKIKDLQEDDEGIYTCEGSNFGSGEDGEIFLDVTSGPIWVKSLRSQTVPENRDAFFTCKARQAIGDDELEPPVWYKNGKDFPANTNVLMILSTEVSFPPCHNYQQQSGTIAAPPVVNDDKYEFSDDSRVLTVKNLNKATDIMCLQCNVSNDIGFEFSNGCLNVIEPIVVTANPGLQHISKGDLVNLTVIGKTDLAYTLQYKWYFNDRIYENSAHPPFVTYNETTKHAYINTSDLTDEDYRNINGTYIRELYHKDDQLNVSVHVLLREQPALLVIQPATVAAVAAGIGADAGQWLIPVIVAVAILLLVIILIAVVNRKQQKGTYLLGRRELASNLDPEKDIADSGFHALTCAQDEDDYPTNSFLAGMIDNINDKDDMDMDDDQSLAAYENEEFDNSRFNEDGSFLGKYGGDMAGVR